MDLLEYLEDSEDSEDVLEQDKGYTGQGIDELIEQFKDVVWDEGCVDDMVQVLKQEDVIKAEIEAEINGDSSDIVGKLSMVVPLVRKEVETMYECVWRLYEGKFSELRMLISDSERYVKAVEVLEESSGEIVEKLGLILSKEEVLVVSMSLKDGFDKEARIRKEELRKAIEYFKRVVALRSQIEGWFVSKIERIAPNLNSLVGPEVASRLISHCGGVKELSRVPSCNLASIGRQRIQRHGLSTDMSGVRQQGIIFQSELIQSLPVSYQKKAVRMLCAKICLAARSDCSKHSDGNLGSKWRQEILDKLLKVMEPPNIGYVKPLPIPEDAPKKQRAGRRFRKYKQQFQLSHLRQMQNRMVFAQEEQVVMDAFGDEVGLGMANTRNVSALSSNYNNKAKLTKLTMKRLHHEHTETSKFLQDERSHSLKRSATNPIDRTDEISNESKQRKKYNQNEDDNDWFTKHL